MGQDSAHSNEEPGQGGDFPGQGEPEQLLTICGFLDHSLPHQARPQGTRVMRVEQVGERRIIFPSLACTVWPQCISLGILLGCPVFWAGVATFSITWPLLPAGQPSASWEPWNHRLWDWRHSGRAVSAQVHQMKEVTPELQEQWGWNDLRLFR